jgi:hypothetical protein
MIVLRDYVFNGCIHVRKRLEKVSEELFEPFTPIARLRTTFYVIFAKIFLY